MILGIVAKIAGVQLFKRVSGALSPRAWAVVGVCALLVSSGWYINNTAYNRGYLKADAMWAVIIESELLRQRQVNEKALAASRLEIERLQEAKEVRDATIERLNSEAQADVNADRPSLGVDSVRRLNAFSD